MHASTKIYDIYSTPSHAYAEILSGILNHILLPKIHIYVPTRNLSNLFPKIGKCVFETFIWKDSHKLINIVLLRTIKIKVPQEMWTIDNLKSDVSCCMHYEFKRMEHSWICYVIDGGSKGLVVVSCQVVIRVNIKSNMIYHMGLNTHDNE